MAAMALDALLGERALRFIFVGGKGGVGKTTTSSAIAAQLSYDRRVTRPGSSRPQAPEKPVRRAIKTS